MVKRTDDAPEVRDPAPMKLHTWAPQVKLLASDGLPHDCFGTTVSISGDTVVVGAATGHRQEAVYVFVKRGSTWIEQAELLQHDPGPRGGGGRRVPVSVSGNTVAVKATSERIGAVYIFVRRGDEWTEQAKLVPSDGAAGDGFGASVSLSGATIAVGQVSSLQASRASVYIFVRRGDEWIEEAKLLPRDGTDRTTTSIAAPFALRRPLEDSSRFGASVSLSEDTVVVGAPLDRGNGVRSGSVYVFARRRGEWVEEAKLLPSEEAASEHFGSLVSVSGDTVVVGASVGPAYIFVRSQGVWTEQARLASREGGRPLQWTSVAVSGDRVAVGTVQDKTRGMDAGVVHLFERSQGVWTEQARLLAGDGMGGECLGSSVALSFDILVAGAPGDNHRGDRAGSAYVFTWEEPNEIGVAAGHLGGAPRVVHESAPSGGRVKRREWDHSLPAETVIEGIEGIEIKAIYTPMAFNTRDVFFTSDRVGYLATVDGKIAKTTDDGASWTVQAAKLGGPLFSICFPEENTGYAAGGYAGSAYGGPPDGIRSILLKTTDGGATWAAQRTPSQGPLADIHFVDSMTGFAVGTGFITGVAKATGFLLKTTNSGEDWRAVTMTRPLRKIHFCDRRTGYGLPGHGNGRPGPGLQWRGILRTEDGGETWHELQVPDDGNFLAIACVSKDIIYAAGESHLWGTTDGGRSFCQLSVGCFEDVYFTDTDTGFAVSMVLDKHPRRGTLGAILMTRDGGRTWSSSAAVSEVTIANVIHCPTRRTGYIAGLGPYFIRFAIQNDGD